MNKNKSLAFSGFSGHNKISGEKVPTEQGSMCDVITGTTNVGLLCLRCQYCVLIERQITKFHGSVPPKISKPISLVSFFCAIPI